MRIPSRTTSSEVGFNMTPMIDVVFQLIIFFLLSSHLARQETHLPLPLPAAVSSQAEPPQDRPRLTVNVLADGTLLIAGRPILPAELTIRLGERRTEHGGELAVRIRGDRAVPYRYVEPVLLACVRAGIWNVSWGVVDKEEIR